MILADTSVWSLALRRRPDQLNQKESEIVAFWTRLALQGELLVIGPVRQELLSGVRHQSQYTELRKRLDSFAYAVTSQIEYDRAAECFNRCRSHGISAQSVDMIICASAIERDLPIMSTDPDFVRYARHLPIRLLPL